ncbi:MAG: hypothetical protein AAGA17_19480 [Actinomycetota bacterium]
MKKLFLVGLALVAGGIVVGASPGSVVDATQSIVGVVIDQSDEMEAEQRYEAELDGLLDRDYGLLDEPLCDAQGVPGTGGDDFQVSALECRVATVGYGVIEVSGQLRGDRVVLVLTDADTTRFIEIVDDPSIAEWLPLVAPEPTG